MWANVEKLDLFDFMLVVIKAILYEVVQPAECEWWPQTTRKLAITAGSYAAHSEICSELRREGGRGQKVRSAIRP